jgi:hypothetical protein
MRGYVASMLYKICYVPLPGNSGVLNAMERARVMPELRVCVANVHGADDDVGRLAFTLFCNVHRLGKGRMHM